jgi:F-type H+-transporting ATPase subunit a
MGQDIAMKRRFLKAGINTLFALLFLLPLHANASGEEGGHGSEQKTEYDAGKSIMDHVTDGYSIHFFTVNKGTEDEWHASIPLPIIAYTDEGTDVFMSSKLHHGHATYKSESTGYEYGLKDGDLTIVNGDDAALMDLSITRDVAGMFFVLLLLCLMFIPVARAYQKREQSSPKGWQALMEPLILFIRDEVAKPNIGEKRYQRFMPFLLTVFFFILVANIAGLMPFLGGFNVTGNIGIIAVLAGMVLIVTNVAANKEYWRHIFAMPGIPVFLYPIMIPIELVQIISKPFVLMVRLTANMTAGHIIILSFAALIMMFGQDSAATGYSVSVGSVLFMIFMNMLKLLISFIQAYVFVLLSAIYFGSAMEEAH